MSDYLAIAMVTATIHNLLDKRIQVDVPGATVTHQPPDIAINTQQDVLNLFLYHVTENVAYRNLDLPTRDRAGALIRKPRLGLNLHYIITALATELEDKRAIKAHQILASAMRTLHENPTLTPEMIIDTKNNWPDPILANSDLATQVELVRITPQSLSLDEITKLWSSFFQTNYRISATYEATVVILDSTLESKPSLPVINRQINTMTFRRPMIEQIQPQVMEYSPNALLTITGRNLQSKDVSIEIGGVSVMPPTSDVSDALITLNLPAGLTPGVKTVQIIQPILLDSPLGPTPHKGFDSNVLPFVLAPRIMNPQPIKVVRGNKLILDIQPSPGSKQEISLLVGDYEIHLPQGELSVTIPTSMPVGKSLLRIRVDGAESFLKIDQNNDQTYGQFISPIIELS